MKRTKDAGVTPAEQEPVGIPNKPVTVAEWREKITGLTTELQITEAALADRAAARKKAAARLLLGIGGTLQDVEALESEENNLEHRADGLRAAMELAGHEVRRIEEAQRQARLAELRAKREAIHAQLLEHAERVDVAFNAAARAMEVIAGLLIEYQQAGGAWHRDLKGTTTRAAIAAGLRDFLEVYALVSRDHLKPLAQQLAGLPVVPGMDERLADMPPAA